MLTKYYTRRNTDKDKDIYDLKKISLKLHLQSFYYRFIRGIINYNKIL